MLITELPRDTDLEARLGQSSGPRTRGVLHLSDIIKALMKRIAPKRFGGVMNLLKVEIGLLFENILERGLAEKWATERVGEIVSEDGNEIYMSPDGVNPTEAAGEEYKATFMSSRDGIFEIVDVEGVNYHVPREKFRHWFIQMMGYAKWMGTRIFILTVIFICGDYKRPIGPEFKRYRIEFNQEEIDINWDMLVRVAREEGLLQ